MHKLFILMALGLWAGTAHADGGYFPDATAGTTAATTDQRAVLLYENGSTTLYLHTGYQGSGGKFGWVIPTASLLTANDVSVAGTTGMFERLHELCGPRLVYFDQGCGAYGCAAEDAGDGNNAGQVKVFDAFTVGEYDITVLGASDSADLATWLRGNGYSVPTGSDTVFDDYVARGYYFTAVRFSNAAQLPINSGDSADTSYEQAHTHPLMLRFPGTMVTFPLLISSLSTKRRVEVLLYTIAAQRFTLVNRPVADMVVRERFTGDDFTAWYDARFDEALAEVGEPGFLVEFAAPVDGLDLAELLGRTPDYATAASERWFITRFRSRLAPEQMTEDLQLIPTTADLADKRLRLRVMYGGRNPSLSAALPWDWLLLSGLGLGLWWRRRRNGGVA